MRAVCSESSMKMFVKSDPGIFTVMATTTTTTTKTTSYNFLNLCRDVLVDEQTTMYWMIRRHLLASTMQFPKCM